MMDLELAMLRQQTVVYPHMTEEDRLVQSGVLACSSEKQALSTRLCRYSELYVVKQCR